jgi:hypothetical protein
MIGQTPRAADAEDSSPVAQPDSGEAIAGAAEGETNAKPREIGGRDGPEPTRYGDWEKNGRCIDF